MATVIKACTCTHAYQDQAYGPGRRVMNVCRTDAGAKPKYRCTVCGQVRE